MNLIYPLEKHVDSYKQGKMGSFGWRRGANRSHAGCDLVAKPGTPVYCMADCKIIRVGNFIKEVSGKWSKCIETQLIYQNDVPTHADPVQMIIRYCEVRTEFKKGDTLKAGDVFAHISDISGRDMLHLEMYSGTHKGKFTQVDNGKYHRRNDLINPTPWLKVAELP